MSPNARAWLMATRPQTLPAGLLPVMVATALAHHDGALLPQAAWLAGLGAVLIQIGTNLFNDWADFYRGADTAARLGPIRVTQRGLIPPAVVWRAAMGSFLAAAVCGLGLLPLGGWPILGVGILSLLSGVAYTGGPYPLAYIGLGDLFVFVFFGLTATSATYYLHTGHVTLESLLLGASLGAFATGILVVNNLRDRHTDAQAHKRTLAVRLGPGAARAQYWACMLLPYGLLAVLATGPLASFKLAIPLVSLPWAVVLGRRVMRRDGADLNPLLGQTARLEALYAGCLVVALVS